MANRRTFLQIGGFAAAGVVLPWRGLARNAFAALPGGTLDPLTIGKYLAPLVVPPEMPASGRVRMRRERGAPIIPYYDIVVRQFQQQVLPPGLPPTTVWSYGSAHHGRTFNYPAYTIEAQVDRPIRVRWANGLMDRDGHFLPHLLPVDQTLHWANPPGPPDMDGMDPTPYLGPVPMVTHVHGAHTADDSDGYPEAWYLPAAVDTGAYVQAGSRYAGFKAQFEAKWGHKWLPGSAVFHYPNDARASTLWYHDHTLGMTRLNVYAGPAGFYILRGGSSDLPPGVLPGPAPRRSEPAGTRHYEIPLAIQDRSFNADGSLFYPPSREFFDGFDGPFVPDSDMAPIWNPEFFGNTLLVNGRTWPVVEVEPRRYRFRLLNGCNARFLILKLVADPLAARPASPALPFWQIGAEGGFLAAAVQLDQLLMAPAERADVIVDLTGLSVGTELYLINEAPDEPFGGGLAGTDFDPADPATSGQVMKLVVAPLASADTSIPPASLTLPALVSLGTPVQTRTLTLNELDSAVLADVGPREAQLGTLDANGFPVHLGWDEPITELVTKGDTELWEIYNFTADAHPIHVHQVQFQVMDRQGLVTDAEGISEPPARLSGPPRAPESWESGRKDTVVAYPGEVTRIKVRFDLSGLFVWHCHIVEHEDNEMMRPLSVT